MPGVQVGAATTIIQNVSTQLGTTMIKYSNITKYSGGTATKSTTAFLTTISSATTTQKATVLQSIIVTLSPSLTTNTITTTSGSSTIVTTSTSTSLVASTVTTHTITTLSQTQYSYSGCGAACSPRNEGGLDILSNLFNVSSWSTIPYGSSTYVIQNWFIILWVVIILGVVGYLYRKQN